MSSYNQSVRFAAGLGMIALAGALASGCATTTSGPVTDSNGMTLYTFDKDARGSGDSSCYDGCAATWPPVPAAAAEGGNFGSMTRRDGARQLTYQGRPVYYYVGDTRPGDKTGDGVGGVWHAIEQGHNARNGGGGTGGY